MPIEIRTFYEAEKESKYRKLGEMQIQQEVDAIVERNQSIKDKKEEEFRLTHTFK